VSVRRVVALHAAIEASGEGKECFQENKSIIKVTIPSLQQNLQKTFQYYSQRKEEMER